MNDDCVINIILNLPFLHDFSYAEIKPSTTPSTTLNFTQSTAQSTTTSTTLSNT